MAEDGKIAVRMVLSAIGREQPETIRARLEALGVGDLVVTPRAVNLKLDEAAADRLFHTDLSKSTPQPPDSATLKALQLDEFVDYVYFPTAPTYFGR